MPFVLAEVGKDIKSAALIKWITCISPHTNTVNKYFNVILKEGFNSNRGY